MRLRGDDDGSGVVDFVCNSRSNSRLWKAMSDKEK